VSRRGRRTTKATGRGRGGGRRKRGSPRAWSGLLILVLAGAGVWYGAAFMDGDGSLVTRSLEREETAAPPLPRPIPEPGARVRVEVLNAGGVRGMAASATEELRDAGFDVVYYGNAGRFDADESEVVLRWGPRDDAFAVAQALGIDRVLVEMDSTLLVEVTVRLGSGWRTRAERGRGGEDGDEDRNRDREG
jgi:hypothetical protein